MDMAMAMVRTAIRAGCINAGRHDEIRFQCLIARVQLGSSTIRLLMLPRAI
jgi:hypothetical protein